MNSIWRPLPFLILSNKKFDSKNVPGPDCQSLCQIWCESVQYWPSYRPLADVKMADAAILNCYFVTVDHPRSLLHGPNIVLKFHVNRITTFVFTGRDAAITVNSVKMVITQYDRLSQQYLSFLFQTFATVQRNFS